MKRDKITSKLLPNVRNEVTLYDLPEYKELRKEELLWKKARGQKLDRKEFPIGICIAKKVSNYICIYIYLNNLININRKSDVEALLL